MGIHLIWTGTSGPYDELCPLTQGPFETVDGFADRVSKWGASVLTARPPIGCVRMTWCSNGTAKDEQVCPNPGESTADFIARATSWIEQMLTDFPPTNDCP